MADPYPAPAGVDPSRASIARVYDAGLGGKDNFQVDRDTLAEFLSVEPNIPEATRKNRWWLVRVVGYLAARAEFDQFLDLGSGLPTVQNTHEVAQQYQPEATVVYVDNDPAVNAYGRALLTKNPHTSFATADLTRVDEVLATPEVQRLDWSRPLVLLQCATLHHLDDDQDPWAVMRRYVEALPSGSYVGITHWWNPSDDSPAALAATELEQRVRQSSLGGGRLRTREEITALFDGLELIDPGVVPIDEWWPAGPPVQTPSLADGLWLGGVGVKP